VWCGVVWCGCCWVCVGRPPLLSCLSQWLGPNFSPDCIFLRCISFYFNVGGGWYLHERTQTGSVMVFGKRRKPEIRICHTYDRAHVRKKGVSLEVLYSLSRRKLAVVCLSGSQSDLLLCTPHRTNAVESSDLLNRLQIYSHSVGKLKSLYEYLIGKHIHKLIRKSVPYACSPWVELGLYVGLLTSSVRFWKAA
jgi:hypothetical protein